MTLRSLYLIRVVVFSFGIQSINLIIMRFWTILYITWEIFYGIYPLFTCAFNISQYDVTNQNSLTEYGSMKYLVYYYSINLRPVPNCQCPLSGLG